MTDHAILETGHRLMRQDTDPYRGDPEHGQRIDAYFSADVETDGPIPGPYSMLSFALVYAGCYDGQNFKRPETYNQVFYAELRPISDGYEQEALNINGMDRNRLIESGMKPSAAMNSAASWVSQMSAAEAPFLWRIRLALIGHGYIGTLWPLRVRALRFRTAGVLILRQRFRLNRANRSPCQREIGFPPGFDRIATTRIMRKTMP